MQTDNSISSLPENWVENLFCYDRSLVYYSKAILKKDEVKRADATINDRVQGLVKFLENNNIENKTVKKLKGLAEYTSHIDHLGNSIGRLRSSVLWFRDRILEIISRVDQNTLGKMLGDLSAEVVDPENYFIVEIFKATLKFQEIKKIDSPEEASRQFFKLKAFNQGFKIAKTLPWPTQGSLKEKGDKEEHKEIYQRFYDNAFLDIQISDVSPDPLSLPPWGFVKGGFAIPYAPLQFKENDIAGRYWFLPYYRTGLILPPTYSIDETKKTLLNDLDKFFSFCESNSCFKLDVDHYINLIKNAKKTTILSLCQDVKEGLRYDLARNTEELKRLHELAVSQNETGLLSNIFRFTLWSESRWKSYS